MHSSYLWTGTAGWQIQKSDLWCFEWMRHFVCLNVWCFVSKVWKFMLIRILTSKWTTLPMLDQLDNISYKLLTTIPSGDSPPHGLSFRSFFYVNLTNVIRAYPAQLYLTPESKFLWRCILCTAAANDLGKVGAYEPHRLSYAVPPHTHQSKCSHMVTNRGQPW